ncbi:WD40 repeat domain-containing protein [Methanoculleus sp. UBA208]|nr:MULTISPECIES: PQQ-binding-like beta-propeller repeat protein [unclassified Methanoculleus]
MSSGEVTSSNSTAEDRAALGIVQAAHSCRETRMPRAGRIITSLLLFCCLIAALCGTVSADEGDYAPLWELGANDAVSSVAVTQDGSTIAACAGSTVYLLDRQGDVLWKTAVGSRVQDVGISPEGSRIGVAADKLYLFDREGNLLWAEKTTFIYRSVALSSNGMYVATGCDNGAVYIFDRNKKQLWDYDMGTDSYGIAISENGRRIAIGCDDQGVYLLNSREGESWSYGTGKCVEGIALTLDGRFVAAGSLDRCVYLSTGEGEHLWKYPTENAVLSTALTNEANRVFAASGRTIYVLDRAGAELQKIGLNGRAESVAVTPDGSFLVVGGGEGDRSIRLFTDDAALIGNQEPIEAELDEVEPLNQTASEATVNPSSPDDSTDTVAETNARARAEEVPITTRVLGWVENIVSLLFEPQEGFLA